jgi:hypothetical protein
MGSLSVVQLRDDASVASCTIVTHQKDQDDILVLELQTMLWCISCWSVPQAWSGDQSQQHQEVKDGVVKYASCIFDEVL